VLSWGSLAEGLLTEEFDLDSLEPEDFRRQRPNFQEPRYSRIRALTAELSAVGRDHGRSSQDVALAWMRSRDGLTGAIVGVRSEREAQRLAEGARWDAPDDVIGRVDEAVSRFDRDTAAG
jgi:aryl-alcohol dehydrogenase-like predicted oxidoreductase